jgi:hypothetical protein
MSLQGPDTRVCIQTETSVAPRPYGGEQEICGPLRSPELRVHKNLAPVSVLSQTNSSSVVSFEEEYKFCFFILVFTLPSG